MVNVSHGIIRGSVYDRFVFITGEIWSSRAKCVTHPPNELLI